MRVFPRLRLLSSFQGLLCIFLLVLTLTVLVGVVATQAQDSQEQLTAKEQELKQLRRQIQAQQRKAQELAQDEESQLERLTALEREASGTTRLLAVLSSRQADLESEIATLEGEIASYQQRLEGHKARLAARLRDMYVRGRHHRVSLLLTSDDLSQLRSRIELMGHVARGERRIIDEVQAAQRGLGDRRARIEENLAEVYSTRSETEERNARLGNLRNERQRTLADIQAEKAGYEASSRELEKAAKAMERLLEDLERKRLESTVPVPSSNFANQRGQLPWPVSGTISQPFGRSVHPQFKTVVMNKGINIPAASGTPIRCVGNGVVEYVNWLPGYGKCIIVNHGDGFYTLYAHASTIFPAVGESVAAEQVIAEVGDTGSLDGSQLYFEVRKGKEPVDPSDWLGR